MANTIKETSHLNDVVLLASSLVHPMYVEGGVDNSIYYYQDATGAVGFGVKSISIDNVNGLATRLTTIEDEISALETEQLDLSAYSSEAVISLTTTSASGIKLAAPENTFTFNNKIVVTEDKISDVLRTSNVNTANGVAGLDNNSLLTVSQLPIDNDTLVIKNGKLAIATMKVNNTYTVDTVDADIPTMTDGTVGTDVEIGDQIIFPSKIGAYEAGSVYIRYQTTTNKIADDYANTSYTFDYNMDSMTQGSNNHYLTTAKYNIVEALTVSDSKLFYSSKQLAFLEDITVTTDNVTITGDGSSSNRIALKTASITAAYLSSEANALPASWSITGAQVTSGVIDVARLPNTIAKSVTATAPVVAAIEPSSGALTISITTNVVNGLVKLDENGAYPALSGSLITNLNAAQLATGVVPTARLPKASGATTFGIVKLASTGKGLTISEDGNLDISTEEGGVVATKSEVEEIQAQVDTIQEAVANLSVKQQPVAFTSDTLADGVLTVTDAYTSPKAICKSDYSNLIMVGYSTRTAPNGLGQSTYTIDLTGLTLTGDWLVLFD